MIIAVIMVMVFILIAYKLFINRIVSEKNSQYEAEIKHQKDIALENTKTQEEERKKMALLVHDDIGNRLNILSLWLHSLDENNRAQSEKIISAQITELIDSARNISHSLYPVNLERLGLVLYIEELITSLRQKIKINLLIDTHYARKDLFTEIQMYRIIQEFTTNVLKHSKASEMTFYIKKFQQKIVLILSDNGEGFEYENVKKGMGLKNIDSRLQSLDSAFKWKNTAGKGSRLIIMIPDKNSL